MLLHRSTSMAMFSSSSAAAAAAAAAASSASSSILPLLRRSPISTLSAPTTAFLLRPSSLLAAASPATSSSFALLRRSIFLPTAPISSLRLLPAASSTPAIASRFFHASPSSYFSSSSILAASKTAAAATAQRKPPRAPKQKAKAPLGYVEKLKSFKPTSPGRRFRRIVDRSHLWKKGPMWHLTAPLRKSGGRGSTGRITVRGRGGGHKRRYRIIDFKRAEESENVVERLEYDPNRSAWIALLKNTKNEEYSYIICPKNLQPGDVVHSGENAEIKNGNCLPLRSIPVGTIVHNIELTPGKGGQLCRSAGSSGQVMKTGPTGFAFLKLPSTEVRMVPVDCRATVGVVSNSLHKNTVLGKAGASRWKGRRPKVRGVAMNPIDHPHGGGEGKGAPGRIPVSPWGKMAKSGKKTRSKHKFSNKFVVEPKKRGKDKKR